MLRLISRFSSRVIWVLDLGLRGWLSTRVRSSRSISSEGFRLGASGHIDDGNDVGIRTTG